MSTPNEPNATPNTNRYLGYLFEVAWILPSVAIPIAFLVAIVLTAFAVGISVPGVGGRIDPKKIPQTAPFNTPGVRELAPGRYEAVVVASTFMFNTGSQTPGEIRVKEGSRVDFQITSLDVIHGFKVSDTPINIMVIPGQIGKVSHTFKKAGEYLIVCHEYCGGNHHIMFGKVIVEK